MDRSLASEEAQRWLGTAEKLLAARDLLGAKSFAIRVREAFPRLESAADDVVAVADTLVAGEARIGPAGHHQQSQPDWYAVLSLPRFTQNMEAVASQYRRLALILNPHRNRLPYADEAFRLVTDAWSVLSNPSKKVFYDNELAMYSRFDFGAGNQTQTQTQTQTQSHHHHHHHQLQEHQFLQRNNPQPLHQHHHHQQQQQNHHFYNQNPSPPPQPPPPPPQQQQQQFHPSPPQFHPPRQPQPPQQQNPHHHHQTQNTMRRSPRKGAAMIEEERPNLNHAAESSRSVRPAPPTPTPSPPRPPPPTTTARQQTPPRSPEEPDGPSFWSTCPFCFILYEYPKVYEDCVLRCQSCKRAFTAAAVPEPPVSDDGTNYFCCWGFFPLGYSGKAGGSGNGSGWSPFSPIFACPVQDQGNKKAQGGGGKGKRKEPSSPKFVYKDEDVFVDISDGSDSSDCDWRNTRKFAKKSDRASRGKAKRTTTTTPKSDRVTRGSNACEKLAGTTTVVVAVPAAGAAAATKGETSRKGGGRRRGGAEWGRLDLNVEFNNDGEDASTATNRGNGAANGGGGGGSGGGGEDDNIGFFEGLDEFLSSLPILNVVGGDEKVKAT